MQTESVLQTKNRSEPAKNRFSVALVMRTLHKILEEFNFGQIGPLTTELAALEV